MKAVVIQAPMEFGIEEVQIPEIPDDGLLLKVSACALCGSDLRTLRYGHRKVKFPWTIGHELCAVVDGAGKDYQGEWKIGETLAIGPVVYCGVCDFCVEGRLELCENYREIAQSWPGGLAEYISIPREIIERGLVQRCPKDIDPAHAALSEPISSCLNAQEKGSVSIGDTVVIIGSGPIGSIHTSLAHLRGAKRVIIADIVAERLELVEAFNPDYIIDASKKDLVQEVLRLTNGKGADVVITANPVPQTQVQAVEMARKGGRILLFGGLPVEKSKPGVDMNIVHYNGLHIIGTTIFSPRHHRQALELVINRRIPVEKLITRFPLEDFSKGAELALTGKVVKAVFLP